MSLLPEEAVLSGDEPTSVDNALSALQAYRTAEIMQDSSAVTELSFKIVEDVISYLSDTPPGGPSHLLGLGILPLEDGTFGTFLDQSDPTHYFVWMPQDQSRYHNFPLHYFVHHKLKVRSLLKMGLNIVPLDSAAIRQFVDKRLPTVSPFDSVPPEVSNWIFDFWETWNEYTYLKLHHTDISEFPLVPTINPNTFVSLAQCKDASVMLVGGSTEEDELLRTCLDQLDLNVVRLDEEPTPIALCLILQRDGYPSLTFENVLRALASQQDSVADKFRDLDNLLAIAQTLPLWPSARNGSAEELRSASDIYMLPEGLSFRVAARFMNVFVADYGMLKSLNGSSLTFEQLGDKVELPSILGTADLMPYKNFLERWIPRLPPSYTRPILVPNANRVITLSNELYAREPLFQAAFGDDSNRFIPEEFVELEQPSLNDRQQEDRAIRAALLFEAYCVSLPMRVGANEQASWHELDELSFIPRDMNLTRRLEDQGDSDAGLISQHY
ncbi:hypothetical protein BDZ97DRAFT_1914418 [Flammula alnicola]|nr:hypothetical protein BDZ97DRAFT_1914418 [Flammula alnicola]